MAKKSHTGFRNDCLFCFNCGTSYDMKLPQPVSMASAMMIQFDKDHKKCQKTWQEPVPSPEGKTEKENADWWLINGERGMSSVTIFKYLGGTDLTKGRDVHPSDPSDFYRCYKLLQAVPQWRNQMDTMRLVSETWNNLVDNWDKLTEMLEEQISTGKSNGMFDLMKSIGC